MVIHNAEYGVWRPEYKSHYYRHVSFSDVPEKNYYAFATGKPNDESEYPTEDLKDDQSPLTVVTYIGPPKEGKRLIRGTASDNGTIKSVVVTGQPTRSLRDDFAEWEISLPTDVATSISASAEDIAGNREPRPHVVALP